MNRALLRYGPFLVQDLCLKRRPVGSANCPSCGQTLRFRKNPQAGLRLTCPSCGTRLDVLGTAPLELDWAFEEPIQEQVSAALEDIDVDDGLAQ